MKKMKLIIAAIIVVLIAAGVVYGYNLQRPVPIVKRTDKILSVSVQYRSPTGEEVTINDFDENALLDYLSTCTMHREKDFAGIPEISIGIAKDKGNHTELSMIWFTNGDHMVNGTAGTYEIDNGEEAFAKVQEILGLDVHS